MMVGAFLISIMMSVGNGLEEFLISQVTMFSNTKTISVRKDVDFAGGGFSIGGGVEQYQEGGDDDIGETEDSEDTQVPESTQQAPANPTDQQSFEPSQVPQQSQSQDEGADADADESEASSERDKIVSESQLDKEDLEKIRDLDHVEVAEFQKFIFPKYIEFDNSEDEEDAENDRFQVTLIALPDQLRKEVNFASSDEDVFDRENSIVLSDSYVEEWDTSREDILGETIYVHVEKTIPSQDGSIESKDFEFVVAGVMEKSLISQMALISNDMINEISAYRFGKSEEDFEEDATAFEVIVVADSAENVEQLDKELEDLGYESDTYEDSIGQIGTVFDIINYLLSSFGIIALIVASIGIINTLLMAIYERTREIGVMKAVGATRRQIGAMFTTEATLLGFWGGLFGLLVGWGIGRLADYVLHAGIKIGNWQLLGAVLADYPGYNVSVFSADIIFLVIGVTTGVAFLAGIYPALRASRLNPIKALRTD